jgi:tetratricopeptide (TPR) repeat protein
VSQSPLTADVDDAVVKKYLDAWEPLHQSILTGGSFSGRERNCCFLNTGSQKFADVSAASGLNHIEDGRAIAVTDWDHDGDLDLWITNRNGPRLKYLRNDMPTKNRSISIRLEGDPKQGCPRDPAGARVTLQVKDAAGRSSTRVQSLYLGDSFISQSSKWLQFGIQADEQLESVSVRWPGNVDSEPIDAITVGGRFRVKQGTGKAVPAIQRAKSVQAFPHDPLPPIPLTDAGRLKLTLLQNPIKEFAFLNTNGNSEKRVAPLNKPLYVVFWASWCKPCLEEMQEIAEANIQSAEVIAINIESATATTAPANEVLKKLLDKMNFAGTQGIATRKTIDALNSRHLESIYVRKELPLPVSFLIDRTGYLRVVYKGAAKIEQIRKDISKLDADGLKAWSQATPFDGRWSEEVIQGDPLRVARIHIQNGNPEDGKEYLNWYLNHTSTPLKSRKDEKAQVERRNLALVHYELGRIAQIQKQPIEAFKHATASYELFPGHVPTLLALISYHTARSEHEIALPFSEQALKIAGGNPRVEYQAGMVYAGVEKPIEAIKHYKIAVEASKGKMIPATNNLAWLLATHPKETVRNASEALRFAKLGCEVTEYKDHRLFDTLAAAFANLGDFDSAIESCQRGISLALKKGDTRTVKLLKSRTLLYKAKQPYRED